MSGVSPCSPTEPTPRNHRFIGSEYHRATTHPRGAVSTVIPTVQTPGRPTCHRKYPNTPNSTTNSCVR
jgi:hypothetical protein